MSSAPRPFSAAALFLSAAALLVHVAAAAAPARGQTVAQPAARERLPDGVQAMVDAIREAIRTGSIEEMRTPIELNELRPDFAAERIDDPIAYWRRISGDGEGREILAALAKVLDLGFSRVALGARPVGRSEGRAKGAATAKGAGTTSGPIAVMYVWPHLAEKDLRTLSAAEQVDLLRLVTPSEATAMRTSGRYTYWRLGIAADGTWHYFTR